MALTPFLFAITACNQENEPGDTGVAVELPGISHVGSVDRNASPSTANLDQLNAENAAFSTTLLTELYTAAAGNLVTSPWSLQIVMAQVVAGADGDSKTAINDTFGWTLAEADFHEAFNAADLTVAAHNDPAADEPVAITSTNQIFVTSGYELGEPWLDTLSGNYGTGVREMDFAGDPSGVAGDINAWIADRTGDHIKDLVTQEMVADSRMLLANALFFKASWAVPFTEESTSDLDFTLTTGDVVSVPTMRGTANLAGGFGDGFFVADIPFTDSGLTMTIVLPDEGTFDAFVSGMTWETMADVFENEAFCEECSLQMPKFEFKSQPPMNEALSALGMGPAFGGSYPGINPNLTLTSIDQQGFIAVNENGAEAAAATVASFSDSYTEPPFGPVVVDHPFVWFIRETDGGAVLFAGIVVDPR